MCIFANAPLERVSRGVVFARDGARGDVDGGCRIAGSPVLVVDEQGAGTSDADAAIQVAEVAESRVWGVVGIEAVVAGCWAVLAVLAGGVGAGVAAWGRCSCVAVRADHVEVVGG